jgi:hypothetical protein
MSVISIFHETAAASVFSRQAGAGVLIRLFEALPLELCFEIFRATTIKIKEPAHLSVLSGFCRFVPNFFFRTHMFRLILRINHD